MINLYLLSLSVLVSLNDNRSEWKRIVHLTSQMIDDGLRSSCVCHGILQVMYWVAQIEHVALAGLSFIRDDNRREFYLFYSISLIYLEQPWTKELYWFKKSVNYIKFIHLTEIPAWIFIGIYQLLTPKGTQLY